MKSRIRREPLPVQIHLGVSVKIHVVLRIGKPDVGQMPRHIAGWEIERAVERDHEVREVAAHAEAALQHVPRRKVRPARHIAILDVFVNPPADRVHARQTVLHLAELLPSEIPEFVRIAITARQRVAQHRRRQIPRLLRHPADEPVVVRPRGHGDDRIVPKTIRAARQRHAHHVVAVAVHKPFDRQILAERKSLEDDRVVAVGLRLDVDQQRRRPG